MAKDKARKASGMFVVIIVLQGKPWIITDEDGYDPKAWPSFDAAMAFTTSGHIGVAAAEQVLIVDCNTGETEVL